MMSVSSPLDVVLRTLKCFAAATLMNPKPTRMRTTSLPERTLSPPCIRGWRYLETGQDGRRGCEAKRGRVASLKIQCHGIADVLLQLLKGCPFRHDRHVDAISSVHPIFLGNIELDDVPHGPHCTISVLTTPAHRGGGFQILGKRLSGRLLWRAAEAMVAAVRGIAGARCAAMTASWRTRCSISQRACSRTTASPLTMPL